jgi:hypothetical protein
MHQRLIMLSFARPVARGVRRLEMPTGLGLVHGCEAGRSASSSGHQEISLRRGQFQERNLLRVNLWFYSAGVKPSNQLWQRTGPRGCFT